MKFGMHAFAEKNGNLSMHKSAQNRNCIRWQTDFIPLMEHMTVEMGLGMTQYSYCKDRTIFTWMWKITKPKTKPTLTSSMDERKWQHPQFHLFCSPILVADENCVGDIQYLLQYPKHFLHCSSLANHTAHSVLINESLRLITGSTLSVEFFFFEANFGGCAVYAEAPCSPEIMVIKFQFWLWFKFSLFWQLPSLFY